MRSLKIILLFAAALLWLGSQAALSESQDPSAGNPADLVIAKKASF